MIRVVLFSCLSAKIRLNEAVSSEQHHPLHHRRSHWQEKLQRQFGRVPLLLDDSTEEHQEQLRLTWSLSARPTGWPVQTITDSVISLDHQKGTQNSFSLIVRRAITQACYLILSKHEKHRCQHHNYIPENIAGESTALSYCSSTKSNTSPPLETATASTRCA